MSGKALTASELANEAGVTLQTASSHLSKLETGGLIARLKQGRHRYFRLADADVAEMLEKMIGVAARAGHMRTRPGPSDPSLRKARVCYDHLAGEMGVRMFDGLMAAGLLAGKGETLRVTRRGAELFGSMDIDLAALSDARRALCKGCLDWSMRREHLGGSLGAALLARIFALGWARRGRETRIVHFTPDGARKFQKMFRVA